ncbi:MAG TPA: tyrosine-type recombinase/integrase [Terriglobales bacterium]
MNTAPEILAESGRASTTWKWPLDLSRYDRNPVLNPRELAALDRRARFPHRFGHWTPLFLEELGRLAMPVIDALDYLSVNGRVRNAVQCILVREIHGHRSSYWAWSSDQWHGIVGSSRSSYVGGGAGSRVPSRNALLGVAYLLANYSHLHALGKYERVTLAYRVFGRDRVDVELDRVVTTLLKWGYSRLSRSGLRMALCEVFIENRSPRLEDITYELLDRMRAAGEHFQRIRSCIHRISRALVGLGIIPRELSLWGGGWNGVQGWATTGVSPQWTSYVGRWYATSTLSPKARKGYYLKLLTVGRWATLTHPDAASPELWGREMAADCVAMVCRKRIGDWVDKSCMRNTNNMGKPITPRTQLLFLIALSTFFRDSQEWEWIPRRLDASRAFAQPRHLRALVRPHPRVLSDDVWAKLLWAGLNLVQDDLPNSRHYPLLMIRAVTIVWLFAGLRQAEIRRLRVGCVRFDPAPADSATKPNENICLLDIPVNKTMTAFTKPVDRAVGDAIVAWEKDRPGQPAALDEKTGEVVHFLFSFRCGRFSLRYLNKTLIPVLCRKAGIPLEDARGRITSHRARSTIATQLFNARQPLSLFELQEWLGHRHPNSTQHYARISPTKLARSYADAQYFQRNLRTIDILIDQEVVRAGTASNEPWRFYDLGHGFCTYDFFDQCPHRMACARCAFYRPKGSAAAFFLEGKQNLLRLQQQIPLTEAEANAIEDGVNAFEKLLAQLADTPTPAGPTSRELKAGLVQLEPANGSRK